MLKHLLLNSVFSMLPAIAIEGLRLCSAEGDAPAAAAGGGDPPPAITTALGTAQAPADDGKAKDAPAADDKTKDQPAKDDAGKDAPKAETPEEKAARLKNETPEQKTAREAEEKAAGEKKVADTLKTYDAVKLPEGVTRDMPAVKDFLQQAAQDGMSADQAQKYVDNVAPKLKEAMDAPYKAWADMQTGWLKELKEDSEIGGADLPKNLGLAAKALDTFAGDAKSPEGLAVRQALEFTGAGNAPAIVRMMVRIGKQLAEGTPLGGKTAPTGDLAAAMYPSMKG